MDKSRLLDKVGAIGDDRLLLAKVLDRAEQAQSRNIPAATDFLSPQQQMVTLDLGIQEAQTLAVRGRPKWIQKYIWQQQNHTASP